MSGRTRKRTVTKQENEMKDPGLVSETTSTTTATRRTTVDTIEITPEVVASWVLPPFQRPLRVNEKVRELAERVKRDGGVLPGVVTLGAVDGKLHLLDGQHRREAFLLSGCKTGFADVRTFHLASMAEMGAEFVALNSSLVQMRPDDVLRGLEGTIEALARIRGECPFVGYDMIRRYSRSPVLSMSTVLRCWAGSATDVPANVSTSARHLALALTDSETNHLIGFLEQSFRAWGREPEAYRLWSALNLTVCMWLYRQVVCGDGGPTTTKVTPDVFGKCLMSVAGDSMYRDWIFGRRMTDEDRAPCYRRLRKIVGERIEAEGFRARHLPQPAWAEHNPHRRAA